MATATHKGRIQESTEQNASISKTEYEKQSRGRKYDIRPIKSCVSSNYSKDSSFYDIVMADDDFLEPADFLAKFRVWDRLAGRGKK